ncbi:MAG: hypothetical protein ACE5GN_06345 [Waddliaceae bacterium]
MQLVIRCKKKERLDKSSDVNAKPWFYVSGRPHRTPQEQASEEGRLKKRKKEIVNDMPVMPPGAKVIKTTQMMELPLMPSQKDPSVRRHQKLFDTLADWREKRKQKRLKQLLHRARKHKMLISHLTETSQQANQAFKGLTYPRKAKGFIRVKKSQIRQLPSKILGEIEGLLSKDLEPFLLLNHKMTAQEWASYKERNKEYLKRKHREDTPDEQKIYPKDPGQTLVDLENQRKLSTPQDSAIYGQSRRHKLHG